MPTLKFVIRPKADLRKDGTCPIFIRITKDRKTTLISTGFYIEPRYWKDGVKSNHPNYEALKHLLMNKEREAWNNLMKSPEGNPKALLSGNDFYKYAEEYIKRFSGNTLKAYNSSLNKLKEFQPVLTFPNLTFEFLRRFEAFLTGSSTNTIAGRMKHIRALYNAACKDGKADRNKNPFIHYKLKWKRGRLEHLTIEELTIIRNLELTGHLLSVRNIFLFQFNCLGMRIGDALCIKWKDIHNGILKYRMLKTGTIKAIALPSEAIDIIGSPGKGYVFPFMDRFGDIGKATAYINFYLKEISELACLDKKLTTHVARHTWASLAIKKDVNPRLIQRALGHSDLKTTEGYMAQFSDKEVDEANKIITG